MRYFEGIIESLKKQTYCIFYNWAPSDLSFAMYTECELRKINRNFGHSKVRTTANLFNRTSKRPIPSDSPRRVEAIARNCAIL